jgi:electron transfer flavoprotein beta subunit
MPASCSRPRGDPPRTAAGGVQSGEPGAIVNIVVTVKQVPDPNTPPKLFTIDGAAKRVVPAPGIPPVMNGYDANALEEAVRLKEQHGGRVTAVGAGDDGARDALRQAIARGATAAVHVQAPADLDSASTAEALAAAIARLAPFDLVLCGRQASDTDGGQVLFGLAELLGLPAVSPIKKVVEVEAGALVVDRITEDGAQRIRVELPALIGVSSEANQPRYPAMKGTLIARRAEIPTWQRADLGLGEAERRVEVRRLYVETREARTEFIEADSPAAVGARLAERLREAGLI